MTALQLGSPMQTWLPAQLPSLQCLRQMRSSSHTQSHRVEITVEGHIDVVVSWLHRLRLSPNVTKPKTMTFNPALGHPETVFTMRGVQLQAV